MQSHSRGLGCWITHNKTIGDCILCGVTNVPVWSRPRRDGRERHCQTCYFQRYKFEPGWGDCDHPDCQELQRIAMEQPPPPPPTDSGAAAAATAPPPPPSANAPDGGAAAAEPAPPPMPTQIQMLQEIKALRREVEFMREEMAVTARTVQGLQEEVKTLREVIEITTA